MRKRHERVATVAGGGRQAAAALATLLVCALPCACVPPQPPPPRPSEAEIAARSAKAAARQAIVADKNASRTDGLKGGTLAFEDDFERADLGSDWQVLQPGEWQIKDGRLHANHVPVYDDRNKGVWLNKELPAKARIEFESLALDRQGDTKCEVFARSQSHESGYSLIFGGWNNTINTIARLGEHEAKRVVQRPHVAVQTNKTYRWTIVRTDNVVRWYIDDKFMIAYDDADPVQGRHFAFNNWLTKVSFDKVRIWAL